MTWVEVATDLLPMLREWSDPVQVRVTGDHGCVLEMEIRTLPHLLPSCEHDSVDTFSSGAGRRVDVCLACERALRFWSVNYDPTAGDDRNLLNEGGE